MWYFERSDTSAKPINNKITQCIRRIWKLIWCIRKWFDHSDLFIQRIMIFWEVWYFTEAYQQQNHEMQLKNMLLKEGEIIVFNSLSSVWWRLNFNGNESSYESDWLTLKMLGLVLLIVNLCSFVFPPCMQVPKLLLEVNVMPTQFIINSES